MGHQVNPAFHEAERSVRCGGRSTNSLGRILELISVWWITVS